MLSEPASVLAASPAGLVLQSGRHTACSACSLKPGCGHHLLAPPDDRLHLKAGEIAGSIDLQGLPPGCGVNLQVESAQVLRLALYFYVLPLVGLLLGALLALLPGVTEATGIAAALVGLLGGLFLARVALRRQGTHFKVVVTHQAQAAEESSS